MATITRTSQSALESNVIDMALGFTATMRVFEKRSKTTIAELLTEHLDAARHAACQEAFEEVHAKFCRQFVEKVRVAERKIKNGPVKPARAASYGHAAKMFDV